MVTGDRTAGHRACASKGRKQRARAAAQRRGARLGLLVRVQAQGHARVLLHPHYKLQFVGSPASGCCAAAAQAQAAARALRETRHSVSIMQARKRAGAGGPARTFCSDTAPLAAGAIESHTSSSTCAHDMSAPPARRPRVTVTLPTFGTR
jgi:hypothetical protein